MACLAFDNRNADLLFQVISRRCEKKSIVLATNLAFRDWPTALPNASCATALIDRMIHHADVITIEGTSHRRRDAELATAEWNTPAGKGKRPTDLRGKAREENCAEQLAARLLLDVLGSLATPGAPPRDAGHYPANFWPAFA